MLITIFTPTYNRAHTLERTFKSLCALTDKDFEWLVVDDGSTDNTEELISEWKKAADFTVRYFKKTNGGKHTAYNVALQHACGELFFDVDSDDWLPEDFMQNVRNAYNQIKDYSAAAGVIAMKSDMHGLLLGKPFCESGHIEQYSSLKDRMQGEYSLVFMTDIAKKHKFPVFDNECFIPETVVYDRFAPYDFLISNDVLTICEYQPDGLSCHYNQLIVENPRGYLELYRNRMDSHQNFFTRISTMIQVGVFSDLFMMKHGRPAPESLSGFWNVALRPFTTERKDVISGMPEVSDENQQSHNSQIFRKCHSLFRSFRPSGVTEYCSESADSY